MGSFLLIVIAAIIVAGIVFGVAAFTIGGDRGLTPPRPDGVPFDLPPDRPLDRADVEELRLDTTLRGYRMSQVDTVLERVSDDLDFLYARIADLEDQLAGRVAEDEEVELELPSWVKSDESAASGSAASGSDAPGPDATEAQAEGAKAEPVAAEAVDAVEPVTAGTPPKVETAEREAAGLPAADLDAADLDATDLEVVDLEGEEAVPHPTRSGRRG